MNEIDVLPEDLQRKSLSHQEIVLPYKEVLQAIDFLVTANWALQGWEGWIQYPDEKRSHAPGYLATLDIDQYENEIWSDFVQRSSLLCKETITAEQQRWNTHQKNASLLLYFCLTATNERK